MPFCKEVSTHENQRTEYLVLFHKHLMHFQIHTKSRIIKLSSLRCSKQYIIEKICAVLLEYLVYRSNKTNKKTKNIFSLKSKSTFADD